MRVRTLCLSNNAAVIGAKLKRTRHGSSSTKHHVGSVIVFPALLEFPRQNSVPPHRSSSSLQCSLFVSRSVCPSTAFQRNPSIDQLCIFSTQYWDIYKHFSIIAVSAYRAQISSPSVHQNCSPQLGADHSLATFDLEEQDFSLPIREGVELIPFLLVKQRCIPARLRWVYQGNEKGHGGDVSRGSEAAGREQQPLGGCEKPEGFRSRISSEGSSSRRA